MPNQLGFNALILNKIEKLGVILMMGVSMSACSSTERWKEEVRLSDGRIIVIDRETLHERGGDEWASNRSGIKPKEYRIRFVDPRGSEQMLEWRSAKKFETWPEIPLILDVETDQPMVISSVSLVSG
jgi:hypothetical protein